MNDDENSYVEQADDGKNSAFHDESLNPKLDITGSGSSSSGTSLSLEFHPSIALSFMYLVIVVFLRTVYSA